MDPVIVMGLNCSHDAAAAVAIDGKLVAAISEERLTRKKHKGDFPQNAIDYCLKEAGLDKKHAKVRSIVINQFPPRSYERQALGCFCPGAVDEVIANPSHHYLHACYAEMLTDRRPLIILIVDGSGYSYAEHKRQGSPLLGNRPVHEEMWESLTAYYVAEDSTTSLLVKDWGEWRDYDTCGFPSLGHMYGMAAQHIFGSWTHAGKVMGLAPYGDPERLNDKSIVTLGSEGVEVDTEWLVKVPRIPLTENLEKVAAAVDIAAKVQAELEKAMMHLCKILHKKTGCQTICLGGGVALNSVFNGLLANEGLFEEVLVSPASHDAGTAIGAAAYGYKQATGQQLRFCSDPEFLGHSYSDEEVLGTLNRRSDMRFAKLNNPIKEAAQELAAGKIVGWFDGKAEFGPRALGHRSILADPRVKGMKDQINSRVKFRESFRPYAAAILEESCAEWFEQSVASPHMLMVASAKAEKRTLIPAVLHVDNTCRLQTVSKSYPGSLRALIEAFSGITGVPLVLNTSLNIHSQPISETPQDALDCLAGSDLDVLYCGPYRVEKRDAPASLRVGASSCPIALGEYYLVGRYKTKEQETKMMECWIQDGSRARILTVEERDLLMKIDGSKNVTELASEIPDATPDHVVACVQSLCNRGILRLKNG